MKLFLLYTSIFSLFFLFSCDSEKPEQDKTVNKQIGVQNEKKIGEDSSIANDLHLSNDTITITQKVLIKTSKGDILIGLYGEDAPKTVENFLGLVRKRYYDGILFHRVAKNFLIQTGDRNTRFKSKRDEWGKGGRSIYGEPFEDEINPKSNVYRIGYQPGTVAMANRGPNTNTSQFFICLDEARDLEMRWTIFGRVLNGMSVVREINASEIVPGPFEPNDGIPVKPIKILRIKLIR